MTGHARRGHSDAVSDGGSTPPASTILTLHQALNDNALCIAVAWPDIPLGFSWDAGAARTVSLRLVVPVPFRFRPRWSAYSYLHKGCGLSVFFETVGYLTTNSAILG